MQKLHELILHWARCVWARARAFVCVCVFERTVPYNLPLLFIATNSSLFTPNKLITPRSTVEISMRPKRNTVLGEQTQSHTATGDKVEEVAYAAVMGVTLQVHCD